MSHIMLSYNWKDQELVKKVYEKLVEGGVPCWMDIQGDMKVDLLTAIFGVQPQRTPQFCGVP